MKLLLLGPTGDTGKHVLEQALAAGHTVRGVERDFDDGFCNDPAFEPFVADILEDGLGDAADGCDAVISALGLGRDPQTLADPPPLFTEGAVRIVEAMRRADVKRLVVISAAFAARDAGVPLWFRAATVPLLGIFRQMAAMEYVLEACDDIDWTAVRPGWLLDRDRTDGAGASANGLPNGTLRTRRADLAAFLLECATKDVWVKQRPFVARPEAMHLQTPPALLEEILPV
ncbi:MAG: NAD(P)H-binding protein [Parerythrobacter sp.]